MTDNFAFFNYINHRNFDTKTSEMNLAWNFIITYLIEHFVEGFSQILMFAMQQWMVFSELGQF